MPEDAVVNVADNNDVETVDQNPKGDASTETTDNETTVDKTIEKLQKRIGKEQSEKHSLKSQLEKLQKDYDALKQDKSVKELSDEEKAKQAESDKDQKIADLNAKIHRMEVSSETDAVFKEAGLNVGSEILNMVVTDDNQTTLSNAKAFIDFIDRVKADARKEALKGETPRVKQTTNQSAIEQALGLK